MKIQTLDHQVAASSAYDYCSCVMLGFPQFRIHGICYKGARNYAVRANSWIIHKLQIYRYSSNNSDTVTVLTWHQFALSSENWTAIAQQHSHQKITQTVTAPSRHDDRCSWLVAHSQSCARPLHSRVCNTLLRTSISAKQQFVAPMHLAARELKLFSLRAVLFYGSIGTDRKLLGN